MAINQADKSVIEDFERLVPFFDKKISQSEGRPLEYWSENRKKWLDIKELLIKGQMGTREWLRLCVLVSEIDTAINLESHKVTRGPGMVTTIQKASSVIENHRLWLRQKNAKKMSEMKIDQTPEKVLISSVSKTSIMGLAQSVNSNNDGISLLGTVLGLSTLGYFDNSDSELFPQMRWQNVLHLNYQLGPNECGIPCRMTPEERLRILRDKLADMTGYPDIEVLIATIEVMDFLIPDSWGQKQHEELGREGVECKGELCEALYLLGKWCERWREAEAVYQEQEDLIMQTAVWVRSACSNLLSQPVLSREYLNSILPFLRRTKLNISEVLEKARFALGFNQEIKKDHYGWLMCNASCSELTDGLGYLAEALLFAQNTSQKTGVIRKIWKTAVEGNEQDSIVDMVLEEYGKIKLFSEQDIHVLSELVERLRNPFDWRYFNALSLFIKATQNHDGASGDSARCDSNIDLEGMLFSDSVCPGRVSHYFYLQFMICDDDLSLYGELPELVMREGLQNDALEEYGSVLAYRLHKLDILKEYAESYLCADKKGTGFLDHCMRLSALYKINIVPDYVCSMLVYALKKQDDPLAVKFLKVVRALSANRDFAFADDEERYMAYVILAYAERDFKMSMSPLIKLGAESFEDVNLQKRFDSIKSKIHTEDYPLWLTIWGCRALDEDGLGPVIGSGPFGTSLTDVIKLFIAEGVRLRKEKSDLIAAQKLEHEREFEAAEREQAAALKERDDVLNEVMHDIKNVVDPMKVGLEKLRDKPLLPEDQRRQVLDRAIRGTNLVRHISLGSVLSSKGTPADFVKDAREGLEGGTTLEQICVDALGMAVETILMAQVCSLHRDKYFPDKAAYDQACEAWGGVKLTSLPEIEGFMKRYLLPADLVIRNIGHIRFADNRSSATKLSMLMLELGLNSLKHAAFVSSSVRSFQFEVTSDGRELVIHVVNSRSKSYIGSDIGIGLDMCRRMAGLIGDSAPTFTAENDRYVVAIRCPDPVFAGSEE